MKLRPYLLTDREWKHLWMGVLERADWPAETRRDYPAPEGLRQCFRGQCAWVLAMEAYDHPLRTAFGLALAVGEGVRWGGEILGRWF